MNTREYNRRYYLMHRDRLRVKHREYMRRQRLPKKLARAQRVLEEALSVLQESNEARKIPS